MARAQLVGNKKIAQCLVEFGICISASLDFSSKRRTSGIAAYCRYDEIPQSVLTLIAEPRETIDNGLRYCPKCLRGFGDTWLTQKRNEDRGKMFFFHVAGGL